MNVEIGKDGKLFLTRWVYDEDANSGEYVRTDVTSDAHRYLFTRCTIEDGVTLKDVFLLIEKNILLFEKILGNWVAEFVEECFTDGEKDEDISYVEVYWNIEFDEEETFGNARPCFQAIDKNGDAWCISMMPTNRYAHILVRLSNVMTVFTYLGSPGEYDISVYDNPEYSLGQILDAIVRELSYYGPPKKRDEQLKTLKGEFANALEKADTLD